MKRIGVAVAIIGGLVGAFVGTIFFFSSDEREIAREFLLELSSADYEDLSRNWREDFKADLPEERFREEFGASQKYTSVSFKGVSVQANGPTKLVGTATTDLGCTTNATFSISKGKIFFLNLKPLCRSIFNGKSSVKIELDIAKDLLEAIGTSSYERASQHWVEDLKSTVTAPQFAGMVAGSEALADINFTLIETFQDGKVRIGGTATTERLCKSQFAIILRDAKITEYTVQPICREPNTLSDDEFMTLTREFMASFGNGPYYEMTKSWHQSLRYQLTSESFAQKFGGIGDYTGKLDGSLEHKDDGRTVFSGTSVARSGCNSDVSVVFTQDAVMGFTIDRMCFDANKLTSDEIEDIALEFLQDLSSGDFVASTKNWHPTLLANATTKDLENKFGGIAVFEDMRILKHVNEVGRGARLEVAATTGSGCRSTANLWITSDKIRSAGLKPLCRED